ncbi:cation:proton antiporter [candidate division KSB1 bacterium]|nr:cation:proton antiporter [candidate division KSB1 bacterium]
MLDISHFISTFHVPVFIILGVTVVVSFLSGRLTKKIKLPMIIGYMLFGVILGPSFFNILNDGLQNRLSFLTELALGFVALSIGLELHFSTLKKLGSGIITIIFAESFGALIVVTVAVYLLTKNLPMALIFGSIAPASAPAGTVAVIKEYKAKGSLTKALYAVVGFDDGLGIMIFGFAAAISKHILLQQSSKSSVHILVVLLEPLKEIGLSMLFGIVLAAIFCLLTRRLKSSNDIFIHLFGFILIMTGLSTALHLSLILTNMMAGMVIINTQKHAFIDHINKELPTFMPLLFILFFTIAGANLHVAALPSLGLLGFIYILARAFGLIAGSRLGAAMGHVEEKIKKWLGLGILSQAGVAIGLSLIVKHDFQGIGRVLHTAGTVSVTSGDYLGNVVLTTVTATCIVFEIIGPILTKIALEKAGEINLDQ